jgi:type VI secretion system secreted protein Hcp
MRLTGRLWGVASGAALWLALASLPASAAVNAYMKIDGVKQGSFKGEGTRKGSTQWIPIIAISQAVESPRDAASGQASGKRQHSPIKITKETDASSPQLARAAAAGEVLREVVIEFVRPGPKGQEEVYQTITLTNALVTRIQRGGASHAGKSDKMEREEIEITFQKIEVSNKEGKKTASDDWATTK